MTQTYPGAATPEFSFELTREDLLALFANGMNASPVLRLISMFGRYGVPLGFAVVGVLAMVATGDPVGLIIFVVTGALWLFVFPRVQQFLRRLLWKRMIREGPMASILGTRKVAFRDGLISSTSPGGYTEIKVDSIIRVDETATHLFLYNSVVSAIILPKRVLPADVESGIRARWQPRRMPDH